MTLSEAMSELTDAQAAAVAWDAGPMFVLAGPGSGKTRILTTRIARILAETPDRSFRVLALTFTNKAADEMSSRVIALVPDQERRALVGTFHSFCMQMLQQHGTHIGIKSDFAIYSLDADRRELLREALRNSESAGDVTSILPTIDKLKARLVPPEDCARYFGDRETGSRVEAAYRAYEEALVRANALDFGSLIINCHKLISAFPGIAAHYRRTYTYWLLDEFQDTTDGQYRFIKALAGEEFRNTFAVADDDQIIYQWNGASYQTIQKFRADFKPQEIQLPTNYRCPPSIVAAANRLVAHNAQRTSAKLPLEAGKKNLRYSDGHHIQIHRYSTDKAEADALTTGISRIDASLHGEVAVLARNRGILEEIHTALTQKGVKAVIAQRRDDFRSPQFLWLSAVLRLSVRPMDTRALETMVGAFNRWFSHDCRADEVITSAELTGRSFLDQWQALLPFNTDDVPGRWGQMAAQLGRDPGKYRVFVDKMLEELPLGDDAGIDLTEDKAAWSDLSRAISRALGRDASLDQFLQELALRSKEPPTDGRTVTLMTIHGSKGKEFEHVYLAGLAEDILPSFHSLKAGEVSPEMEEERRNCFVAITRAKEWLCLSYADSYRGWQKRPSRFISEMGFTLPSAPEA